MRSAILLLALPTVLSGHGATEKPLSRVYGCYLSSNASEACRAAVAVGGAQAVYDWNGVNIGDAAGRHRERIPDGRLCSAGREQHKGFDLARGDWPVTALLPDAVGNAEFVFRGTAPHATAYFRFYVTRDGYDPTRPLAWSDLEPEPFCEPQWIFEDGRYRMQCRLPAKSGRHLIYTIWQRSDSPEAFYSCSDVVFGQPGPAPSPAWREIGRITAAEALPAGSVVALRVFDSGGRDLETWSVTLTAGQTAAAEWPYVLASLVNARSTLVNAGMLGAGGAAGSVVVAQRGEAANIVYARQDGLFMAVDIRKPAPAPQPPPDAPIEFVYPNGLGSYKAGTVVQGLSGDVYACRPSPFTPWCNLSDPAGVSAYSPGVGRAWQQAWVFLRAGTPPPPPPPPVTVPAYPAGREGYAGGSIVEGRDGKRYECRPLPYSAWCRGAPFYYEPGVGLAWRQAWTRLD